MARSWDKVMGSGEVAQGANVTVGEGCVIPTRGDGPAMRATGIGVDWREAGVFVECGDSKLWDLWMYIDLDCQG